MEDRLHKFAAVVDAGSFTASAAELHLSQPALSAAISKLERELHAELLVHGVRPLTLTPAGDVAYAAAKEIGARTNRLYVRLAELADAELHVAIGMIDSVAALLFAEGAEAALAGSKLKASIVVDNSRNLLAAVERGELDMALVVERPALTGKILTARYVGSEPLLVVCHATQLPRVQAAITNGALPGFISYDQSSTTAQLVSAALAARHVTPVTQLFSTSPEVMLRTVLAGRGAAALPYQMVEPFLAAGGLVALGGQKPWVINRRIARVDRRDRELHPALARLTRQTRSLLEAQSQAASALRQ
ncbi:MAG TPA: LysR family transcriptional regulator [Candidatus Saccharimonadales bacterium]|jgi:DNA-binding transcriptional LysR family regulator|nr:LysR family transcriptional regulator [Candidatus Saccharimonadales bacterium]